MTASIHRLRGTSAVVPGGRVPIVAGSVRLDEAWTPYAYARLQVPATPELVDALDGTTAPRITLQLEQAWIDAGPVADTSAEWAGGTVADTSAEWVGGTVANITADWGEAVDGVARPTVRRTADLHVRHASTELRDGLLALELTSDEGLLRDLANVNDADWFPASTSVRTIVNAVLGMIGAQLQPGPDGVVEIDATAWEPGTTAWQYLTPLVQAAGLRLWCDELRRWWLTVPLVDDQVAPLLSVTGGNVLDGTLTSSRDRGEWYDAVVVRYQWRDTLGEARTAYDTATADGWSRVFTKTVTRPYPGPGAARGILLQLQARRRMLDLSAASDYAAAPGVALRANLPGILEQNGRVSAVEWSFDARGGTRHAVMRLGSRDLTETPADSWLAADPAATWSTTPDVSWNDYTPPAPVGGEG